MLTLLLACSLPSSLSRDPNPGEKVRPPDDRRNREAKTWTVNCQGGADYASIRDAIQGARNGDTLSVAPCTYYGSVKFGGKTLQIISTDGPETTTIFASPGEPVVEASDGEAPGTLLSGFTLSGGGSPLKPAIDDEFSSLTIQDSIITHNEGVNTIYGRSPHLVLERVKILNNTPTEGVVIRSRRGSIVLKDSELHCGTSTIGYTLEHGAAFVEGSTFDCPGQRAVEVFHAPGRVQRSVLSGLLYVENEGAGSEGTIVEGSILKSGASVLYSDLVLRNVVSLAGVEANSSNLTIEASIVTGAACGVSGAGSSVSFRNNDFWGNTEDACGRISSPTANGGFSADPLFVAAGDYRLKATSPCIDAGPTGTAYSDPDGSPNDIGAYGGHHSLGGGW